MDGQIAQKFLPRAYRFELRNVDDIDRVDPAFSFSELVLVMHDAQCPRELILMITLRSGIISFLLVSGRHLKMQIFHGCGTR